MYRKAQRRVCHDKRIVILPTDIDPNECGDIMMHDVNIEEIVEGEIACISIVTLL